MISSGDDAVAVAAVVGGAFVVVVAVVFAVGATRLKETKQNKAKVLPSKLFCQAGQAPTDLTTPRSKNGIFIKRPS